MKLDELPFLLNDINKNMPIITNDRIKIKHSYSKFPKNLKNYADNVNEKFLDNCLATIEDFSLLNPNDNLINWFKSYQKRYFNSVLLKDSFLKKDENSYFGNTKFYHSLTLQNPAFLSVNNKILGSELTAGSNAVTEGGDFTGYIWIQPATGGIINSWYNQIAVNFSAGGDTIRVGAYSDSSGLPNTLYSESGNDAHGSGVEWHNVSEFQILQTQVWLAQQIPTTPQTSYTANADGLRRTKAQSFSTFPNPITGTSASGASLHMKTRYV